MAFDPYDDPTKRPPWPFGGPIAGASLGPIGGPDPGGLPAPMGGLGTPYSVAGPTVAGGGGGGTSPGSGGPAPGAASTTSAPASTNAVSAQPSVGTVLPGNGPSAPMRPMVPEHLVRPAGVPDPRHPNIEPLPAAVPLSPGLPGPGTVTESPAGQEPPKSMADFFKDKSAVADLGKNLGSAAKALSGGDTPVPPLDMAMTPMSNFDPGAQSRSGAGKLLSEILGKRPRLPPTIGGAPMGILGGR